LIFTLVLANFLLLFTERKNSGGQRLFVWGLSVHKMLTDFLQTLSALAPSVFPLNAYFVGI